MKAVQNKKGKIVYLLNPNEKAAKFAMEMREGSKLTNQLHAKWADKEKTTRVKLTKAERAYRAGYLQHARESQIIWCKQNGVKSQSLANSKKYWHKQKQKQLNKSFKNYDKVYGK